MNLYFCICAPTWDKLNIRECFLISLYAWRGPQEVDPTDLELPKLPKSTSSAIKNIFGQVRICVYVFMYLYSSSLTCSCHNCKNRSSYAIKNIFSDHIVSFVFLTFLLTSKLSLYNTTRSGRILLR